MSEKDGGREVWEPLRYKIGNLKRRPELNNYDRFKVLTAMHMKMWRSVVWWNLNDVSEKRIASIFTINQYEPNSKQPSVIPTRIDFYYGPSKWISPFVLYVYFSYNSILSSAFVRLRTNRNVCNKMKHPHCVTEPGHFKGTSKLIFRPVDTRNWTSLMNHAPGSKYCRYV